MTTSERACGIDIGGTGMKAAIVDLTTGELISDRVRIETPQPATPEAMTGVISELVARLEWSGPIGSAFPAVVRRGVVGSAANIDLTWIDVDAGSLFAAAIGRPVRMINDADAAGLAEMRLGAGRGRGGVVMTLTFGTGIGSGLFVDGHLVANTELGHLELDGHDAEHRASAKAREDNGWSWKQWAHQVEHFLLHIEAIFSPELIIVGGGVSKRADKWLPYIDIDTEIVVASMRNNAGIVGAALVAPPATAHDGADGPDDGFVTG
jgi:polyphosphate glucokinase